MYSVSLYDPWAVQPQELVEIDREHSVGKDVLAYFNAGESLRFGKDFPTTIGGTPSVGMAGRCIDYSSTKTQYPFDPAIANGLVTPAGCAVFIVCDIDTLTNYGCLFSSEQTGTQRCALELRVGNSATDSKICLVRGISGGPYFRVFDTGANRITAGDRNVRILASFPDHVVTSLPTVYINGVAYATTNTAGVGTGAVGGSTSVGVSLGGRSSDTVTPLDGRIYNAWLIGRAVTAAEGITLTQTPISPYALFASQPIDIWVPSAGAPGGFQAAWARNANSVIQGMRV